jgi:RHS repeat-associated protein
VVKTAVDGSQNERHTVYVFGSLELRGAVFESGEYADTKATEVVYLFAHGVRVGRLHYSEDSLPTLTSGKLHVLLELPDHLGSSSIVIDKGTGELAERTTYLAYGGTESDYRPERWGSFREDYKFTGKEEDEEVGLQYFGKRFFAPGLGRWISPDPLAVHAPGEADLNLYAYVHGNVLSSVDPFGLDGERGSYENPISTNEAPAGVNAGDTFTVIPGKTGVKVFGSADAARAEGAKIFFKYDPSSSTNWGTAKDIGDALSFGEGLHVGDPGKSAFDSAAPPSGTTSAGGTSATPMTAGDWAQRIAHLLTDPDGTGKSGGVAGGACASCEGNEAVQMAEAAFSVYGAAKAAYGAVRYIGGRVAARLAADAAMREVAAEVEKGAAGEAEKEIAKDAVGGSVRTVNPTLGNKNCANCALATDARLAGMKGVTAAPGGPTSPLAISRLYPGKNWFPVNGEKGMTTIMTEAGPGSRGIVWGLRGTEEGHYFNVVNQDGVVKFLDGQSGGPANLSDGFTGFYLLRTN